MNVCLIVQVELCRRTCLLSCYHVFTGRCWWSQPHLVHKLYVATSDSQCGRLMLQKNRETLIVQRHISYSTSLIVISNSPASSIIKKTSIPTSQLVATMVTPCPAFFLSFFLFFYHSVWIVPYIGVHSYSHTWMNLTQRRDTRELKCAGNLDNVWPSPSAAAGRGWRHHGRLHRPLGVDHVYVGTVVWLMPRANQSKARRISMLITFCYLSCLFHDIQRQLGQFCPAQCYYFKQWVIFW